MLDIVPSAEYPPRVLGTVAQNQRWAMTTDFDEQDHEEADPARLEIKRAEVGEETVRSNCKDNTSNDPFSRCKSAQQFGYR